METMKMKMMQTAETEKLRYDAPSVEIVRFAVEDIITNSPTELETTAPDQDEQ